MQNFFCSVYALTRPLYFFVASALFALILWFLGNKEFVLGFIIAFVITFGLIGILKILFKTPRPKNPMVITYGYAFPSGHAAATTFLAVTFYALTPQSLGDTITQTVLIVSVIISLIIGISRVFLRAHTILQVLVGYAVGAVVPLLILL